MYYPQIKAGQKDRLVTDVFAGYNHNLRITDGVSSSRRKIPLELYDTKNMSTRRYPLLCPREKRGVVGDVADSYTRKTYKVGDWCTHEGKLYQCNTAINAAEDWNAEHWALKTGQFTNLQAIIAKDALYWVDNGTMYANGYVTGLTNLQTQRETRLVSMGAYICVFPDKKYINTADLTDYGSMGASWNNGENGNTVTYTMCHADGTIYDPSHTTKSVTAPLDPANGDIWVDISDGAVVKEYSSYTEVWTVIETVYTRVDFTGSNDQIPQAFKELDGVQISGLYKDDLNGSKIIYALGTENSKDYIVLVGIADSQQSETDVVTIERKIPDMDYVCEAQNRLWGCFYGNDGTQNLNEIYCCALGDFKNWEQYLGISTDSWRGSRGSDGPFTGAVNYLGTPTFFKENVIHPVGVSPVGAHQIDDIPARGVQQGCHKSLAIVNETLYYKSRSGVMAYQGGIPVDVGAALGEERYYNAVAGSFGSRYYISMKDASNVWHLFCYDAKTGLWMREDNLHAECFTSWSDELYAQSGNSIVALNGTEGTKEAKLDWYAETGILLYAYPDKKYVSRYDLRLKMEQDAKVQLFLEYDSSGLWEFQGEMKTPRTNTVTLPVRPRRCDHLRIRLEGTGEVSIFSIARQMEVGSDA